MGIFKKRTASRRYSRNRRNRRRTAYRPRLEALESRELFATFNVGPALSLPDAINAANTNNEADVINLLPASETIFFATAEGNNALPVIRGDNGHFLTINGNGAVFTRADGAPAMRFLEVDAGARVLINDVTFRNGIVFQNQGGAGGAINNRGELSLEGTRFESNQAGFHGGAIHNSGQLSVRQSNFEFNTGTRQGGAINNAGQLRVGGSYFADNQAHGSNGGGAITNDGSVVELLVANSVFERNGSTFESSSPFPLNQGSGTGGGAISSFVEAGSQSRIVDSEFRVNFAFQGGAITTHGGQFEIEGSTFFGNGALTISGERPGFGGAFAAEDGVIEITNSTFSNNSSRTSGGAIVVFSPANAQLENNTIADNRGIESAGGLLVLSDEVRLVSNIVAGNIAGLLVGDFFPSDIVGSVVASSANNLVGVLGAANGISNGVNNNLVGTPANPIDPRLGSLQDNGGPTQTRALLPGSPAINAGANPNGLTVDQRGPGFDRVAGGAIDIGAFELQNVDLPPTVAVPIGDLGADEDAPDRVLDVSGVFTDAEDGANLTLSVLSNNPALVDASLNGSSLTLRYGADQNGFTTILLTAEDSAGQTVQNSFGVLVRPVNDAPTADSQSVSTDEDTLLRINLTADDGDPEVTQFLSYELVDAPANGTFSSFNPFTGGATYTPAPEFHGQDSFTFRVTDDALAGGPELTSALATVSITVNAVNDAPVPDAGGPYAINEGDSLTLDASASSDIDAGDVLSYRWDVDGDGDFDENVTGVNPLLSWAELIALGVDDGPAARIITVEVSDGQATSSDASGLTVHNTPPTALINGPAESVPGFERKFTFAAADPSPADEAAGFAYTIDWGDGSAPVHVTGPASGVTLAHTYTQIGSFAIEATAFDRDGGVSTVAQHTVDVQRAGVVDGDVVVGGTSNRDRIIVYGDNAGDIWVRVGAERFGPFTPDPSGRLLVYGLEGDDVVTVAGSVTLPAELHGGEGNDYLAGNGADDMLYGGPGDDRLLGGEGNNLLDGGVGRDYLVSRSGNDILLGGPGDDRLYSGDGDNIVDGGDGDDQITAGEGNDLLRGGAGDDVINARGGNDILLGGDDDDQLAAGAGRDLLIGGLGVDNLYGEDGDDILIGGATTHDANDAALQAILAEWNSAAGIDTRIANLSSGGGLSGGNALAIGSTIFDDGERDDLFGDGGPDWLFELALDQLRNLQAEDRVER